MSGACALSMDIGLESETKIWQKQLQIPMKSADSLRC